MHKRHLRRGTTLAGVSDQDKGSPIKGMPFPVILDYCLSGDVQGIYFIVGF
jgi:hypothetical protein